MGFLLDLVHIHFGLEGEIDRFTEEMVVGGNLVVV